MVGVAGRSKGCHTCRKRRVKCDETKPACYRCVRGSFDCQGYSRQLQWVSTETAPAPWQRPQNFTTTTNDHSPHVFVNYDLLKSSSPPTELSLGAFESDMCFAVVLDNFIWASLGIGWIPEAMAGELGELPREAFKALSQTHFGRREHSRELRLRGAAQYGRVLRATARGLGEAARRRGRQLVGGGDDASGGTAEGMVVAMLGLLLYALYYPYRQWEGFLERSEGAEEELEDEAMLELDRSATISHVEGMARFVEFCGPAAFQPPRMRVVFDVVRISLGVAAIYGKKGSFLAEHQWRSVPWALEPAVKTEQSRLLDVFVVIPGLLEQCEALEADVDTEQLGDDEGPRFEYHGDERAILVAQVTEQLEALFHWRYNWQHRHGAGVVLEAREQVYATGLEDLRGRCLKFAHEADGSVRAAEIALYNALLIWLLAVLWRVEQHSATTIEALVETCAYHASISSLATPDPFIDPDTWLETTASDMPSIMAWQFPASAPSFEPLAAPGSSIELRTAALEICRVYEWQSRHHQSGPKSSEPILLYVYPLGMAINVLQHAGGQDDDLLRWVSDMVTNSPVTSGYDVRRFKMVGLSNFVDKAMANPPPPS